MDVSSGMSCTPGKSHKEEGMKTKRAVAILVVCLFAAAALVLTGAVWTWV